MSRRKAIIPAALAFVLIGGVGWQEAQADAVPARLRLGIQADLQFFLSPKSESSRAMPFSPFLAFEVPLFHHLSVRIGLSPPLGTDDGQQAYATNLALNMWFGRGPNYFEAAVGHYYQNTWCNAQPDSHYYTLYLGWRHMPGKTVSRFGAMLSLTPDGHFAFGLGFGFGRSIRNPVF